MSNYNSNPSKWDPSSLTLDDVAPLPVVARKGRRVSPVRGRFIKGPLDVVWLLQARTLGVKSLLVGLALWHLKGLKKSDSFVVSNLMMQEWDVQADAKVRALRALEKAGLITVERRGRHSPIVTLVVRRPTNGGAAS